jgi:cold shock CspA family protein
MTDTQDVTRYFGIVKWFNNKNGYGFITVIHKDTNDDAPRDVFVHHSAIKTTKPDTDMYRYLVAGEYVEFIIFSPENSHKDQCDDVTGIYGGPLMYESKHSNVSYTQKDNA